MRRPEHGRGLWTTGAMVRRPGYPGAQPPSAHQAEGHGPPARGAPGSTTMVSGQPGQGQGLARARRPSI
eukprot:5796067-Pyramimonas_sp.AAC.1